MLLTFIVFLTVFLGITAGSQLLPGLLFRDAARIRRRLTQEFCLDANVVASSPLYKDPSRLSLTTMPMFEMHPETAPPPAPPARDLQARLSRLLEQANLAWTPRRLFIMTGIASLACGVAGAALGGLLLGLFAAVAGAAGPIMFVQNRRNRRRETYLKQLPAAFDLMARVIRAGQSVPQALQAVADAFDEPLAADFANCQKQQNLGLRPEIAFQQMAERSGILEMRIFAMAMLIQRQSGGNLSDVLERLAGLVRARVKLKQHVRTLTAEGRMQGLTLVVLPFIALGVMLAVNRNYVAILFEHVGLLAGMMTAMAVGVLWIRKIVNIQG